MTRLHYVITGDGRFDRALRFPIEWALLRSTSLELDGEWADLSVFGVDTKDLRQRLPAALGYYPCDLLIVHRDAETEPADVRYEEFRRALERVTGPPPAVCVVPVRMSEAWLPFDEDAIRGAAGNPNGREDLGLPRLSDLGSLPHPEEVLEDLILRASGLQGRRRRRLKREVPRLKHLVAERIEDFEPLRALGAFRRFESDLRAVLKANGWA